MQGNHHVSVRRRREPYPSNSIWFWLLDRIVLTAGIVAPIFTLPQIYLIYSSHSAAGVSVLTWGVYAVLDLPWILYGFAHRERPIIYSYLLWFCANSSVAIGAILYGGM